MSSKTLYKIILTVAVCGTCLVAYSAEYTSVTCPSIEMVKSGNLPKGFFYSNDPYIATPTQDQIVKFRAEAYKFSGATYQPLAQMASSLTSCFYADKEGQPLRNGITINFSASFADQSYLGSKNNWLMNKYQYNLNGKTYTWFLFSCLASEPDHDPESCPIVVPEPKTN